MWRGGITGPAAAGKAAVALPTSPVPARLPQAARPRRDRAVMRKGAMLFVITGFDRPGALELRLQVRPAHLDYLKSRSARIKVGGPLLDDQEQPVGSLLIIEADDRKAAEVLADGDPYRRQGVFERVEIRPWRAALGAWAS
jgi:uncharacterized protein YciI